MRIPGKLSSACIILENLVRTNILLVTYWIFEDITSAASQGALSFLATSSHLFLAIIIQSLGLIIGFAQLKASQYLEVLQRLAEKLKQYSEWLLGSHLLSRALTDPTSLSLTRRNRAVLFMDIRGLTQWSEGRRPEEVVEMLNTCFELAEKTRVQRRIIKSKFTGDEIMIVIADPEDALEIARNLQKIIHEYLSPHALAAGIGVIHIEDQLLSKRAHYHEYVAHAVPMKEFIDFSTEKIGYSAGLGSEPRQPGRTSTLWQQRA